MMGYYKRPDLTKEALVDEGRLHTGDVGEFVDGKYLKITDRLKLIFKTSGGKYIAPQPIENKMKESFFIEQIMVFGENRKYPAALIVPSFPYLRKWCETSPSRPVVTAAKASSAASMPGWTVVQSGDHHRIRRRPALSRLRPLLANRR